MWNEIKWNRERGFGAVMMEGKQIRVTAASAKPVPKESEFGIVAEEDSHANLGKGNCVIGYRILAVLYQMIDNTQAPSTVKAGINKSLLDEIGAGRGDLLIQGSSIYIINRDSFRSIRRGRQLFERNFIHLQGQGRNEQDGDGDINTNLAIGTGLADSCALCHGRPRGSAGVGGNVVSHPDSRDAPHLFGLGLREMAVKLPRSCAPSRANSDGHTSDLCSATPILSVSEKSHTPQVKG